MYRRLAGIPEKPVKKPVRRKKTSTFESGIAADKEAAEKAWVEETMSKDKKVIEDMSENEKSERLEKLKKSIEKNAIKAPINIKKGNNKGRKGKTK